MELFGATREDFARVKVKNAKHGLENPYARYRKEVSIDDVLSAPLVSDPLGLLDICATSDGAAAVVVCSADYARSRGVTDAVKVRAISTVTPAYPQTTIELPNFATDSAAGVGSMPAHGFKESIAARAYDEAGLGPDDLDCAEVYDLSTAMELDWYEQIGLCAPGEGEKLLREGATTIGGRIPVNASGGLACFGEAVPAQAIAQVCELTWQLQGRAEGRQVDGATVGLSINQGLFGHGSAVIVTK
jgi:acetyl-CoA acetyltransferase